VAFGHLGWAPFVAWLAALGLLLRAAGRDAWPEVDRRDWPCLLALTATAAILRLVAIDDVPPGPWIDAISTAVNALHLLDGSFLPFGSTPLLPDGPDWVHTSNLYLYACAAVLKLAGPTLAGVRALSLLPGVAAPPLLYLAGRRTLGRVPALLAGGLLATSGWQALASRWGWDEVAVTTGAVVAFGLALRAEDGLRPGSALLAGAAAGLCLYGYASARLVVVAVVVLLLGRALTLRSRVAVRASAQALAGLWTAAAPLAAFWVAHPRVFTARLDEVSILGEVVKGRLAQLLGNVAAYLGMFHFAADPNPRQALLPGAPALDPIAGALFLLGVIVALATFRQRASAVGLVWLGVGLLGGVFSESATAPNTYRVGIVAPACYLLGAVAWQWLLDRFARIRRGAMPLALTGILCAGSATIAYSGLTSRRDCHACWHAFAEGAAAALVLDRVGPALETRVPVLLDSSFGWPTARLLFDGLLRRARPGAVLTWVEALSLAPGSLDSGVLVIGPSRQDRLPPALRALPARTLLNPFGERVATLVSQDPQLLGSPATESRPR